MDLGPHAAFILTAYAATVLILGGLILWVALDYRAQVRKLANFEDSGLKRRSDAAKAAPPAV
jgi:heme exporter protein D